MTCLGCDAWNSFLGWPLRLPAPNLLWLCTRLHVHVCRHYTDAVLITVVALCALENDVIHAGYLALALLLFRRRETLRVERSKLFKWMAIYNFAVIVLTLAFQAPFEDAWGSIWEPQRRVSSGALPGKLCRLQTSNSPGDGLHGNLSTCRIQAWYAHRASLSCCRAATFLMCLASTGSRGHQGQYFPWVRAAPLQTSFCGLSFVCRRGCSLPLPLQSKRQDKLSEALAIACCGPETRSWHRPWLTLVVRVQCGPVLCQGADCCHSRNRAVAVVAQARTGCCCP